MTKKNPYKDSQRGQCSLEDSLNRDTYGSNFQVQLIIRIIWEILEKTKI